MGWKSFFRGQILMWNNHVNENSITLKPEVLRSIVEQVLCLTGA